MQRIVRAVGKQPESERRAQHRGDRTHGDWDPPDPATSCSAVIVRPLTDSACGWPWDPAASVTVPAGNRGSVRHPVARQPMMTPLLAPPA